LDLLYGTCIYLSSTFAFQNLQCATGSKQQHFLSFSSGSVRTHILSRNSILFHLVRNFRSLVHENANTSKESRAKRHGGAPSASRGGGGHVSGKDFRALLGSGNVGTGSGQILQKGDFIIWNLSAHRHGHGNLEANLFDASDLPKAVACGFQQKLML